jgi:Ser/Thr protein kinase RdoA (MazF antagonist)
MTEREKFAADELAMVLSHYDLGVIEAVKEFAHGSRKSPKLLIRTKRGAYLLKRRAKGRDDPARVDFGHGLQLYLAQKHFPLPHLIRTRRGGHTVVRLAGAIYELFEYLPGGPYDNSLPATKDAGEILALFHHLLRDYTPPAQPPVGSYHQSRQLVERLARVPAALDRTAPHDGAEPWMIDELLDSLRTVYENAASRVDRLGFATWPRQIAHGDWHPGNMLFHHQRVAAVIDYDSTRLEPRVGDLANGTLQFSILGGGPDPSAWPAEVDQGRFQHFLEGYAALEKVDPAELRAVPWLMIEALVTESVFHIAATGSFAHMDGFAFLKMVRRKSDWIAAQAEELTPAR